MKYLLEILGKRSECFEKFYKLNLNQINDLERNDYTHLDQFYSSRETLLQIISKLDNKILFESENLASNSFFPEETKKKINFFLKHKEEIVFQILDQDLRLLSLIESAKTKIILHLKDISSSRQWIKNYKKMSSL